MNDAVLLLDVMNMLLILCILLLSVATLETSYLYRT